MNRRDEPQPPGMSRGTTSGARHDSGAPPRLPYFDGLRAIAAFCVIGVHAAFYGRFSVAWVQDFAVQLQAGVQVFFVISGFLMSKPFIAAMLDDRPFSEPGAYARRRFLRLFPAYWAALVITAFVLDQADMRSFSDWFSQLTLIHAYLPSQFARGLGIAWSLSVEVAFYVFLPFFFLALRAISRRTTPLRALWSGAAGLFFGGMAFVLWTGSWNRLNIYAWLPFELPVFALGIALAILYELRSRSRGPERAMRVAARLAGWWWLLAAAMLALSAELWGQEVLFRARHRVGTQVLFTLFGFFMALPVVFATRDRSLLGRALGSRAMTYVGVVSYGVYLWHVQLIVLIQKDWFPGSLLANSAVALFLLTAILSVGVASVSWYALERPALSLRRTRNKGSSGTQKLD